MKQYKEPEEWAAVIEFEGRYEVSSWGNVRSLDRLISLKQTHVRKCKGKLKNPYKLGDYLGVTLSFGTRELRIREYVHKMVARAFVDNPCPVIYIEANHLDGNKLNNYYKNLKWCTHQQNIQHAWATGLCKSKKSKVETI